MFTRILAATVAGGITIFIYGFVVWGLFLENMMRPHMNTFPGLMNEMPVWAPLVLANLVNAFYLALIFDRWAGIRTFAGGAQAGAIIMFLVSLSTQLMFLAFMNLHKDYVPVAVDLIATAVMGAIAGGVIGQVLGMMKKGEA